MFLGIEIGGTKLQLGIGAGDGSPLKALQRFEVNPAQGAAGILRQIERAGAAMIQRHGVEGIGCGFGGPVESELGRVIKSHQIDDWDGFPLANWLRQTFDVPAIVANDCDAAGLAEARFGAGRTDRVVFYVTVGTGIGGGLIVDQRIYRGSGPAAAEIGHLRPGLHADRPEETVESLASGWAIAAEAQARVSGPISHRLSPIRAGHNALPPEAIRQRLIEVEEADEEHVGDLLERCNGEVDRLTAKLVVQAAESGNGIAQDILVHATHALGWAIAQVITLLAPGVVVIGGGLSLAGEQWFLMPVREAVARYVFPPLAGTYRILPSALGEAVVVQGALGIAAENAVGTKR